MPIIRDARGILIGAFRRAPKKAFTHSVFAFLLDGAAACTAGNEWREEASLRNRTSTFTATAEV